MVVCDLDGFKQVNDRFGHLIGNKVLRLIANGLREHCGPTDYVARMGGDEFVLLIPGGNRGGTRAQDRPHARRLPNARAIPRRSPALLSMSVGVATYPDDGYGRRRTARRSRPAHVQEQAPAQKRRVRWLRSNLRR